MSETRDNNMLDENAVVAAVCSFLCQRGYTIKSKCSTTERGIDVCAEKVSMGQAIHVEAKGATSSRAGSSRFGRPYTESQVFDRVAKGFYTVFQKKGKGDTQTRLVLAVPDAELFRKYLTPVKSSLEAAGIGVFLVGAGGQVQIFTQFDV
jgi:hypothetical protein